MRSHLNKSQFFDIMKKKPALQKILDEFDTLTIEDIEVLKQPKWVRDELVKRKKFGTPEDMMNNAKDIADAMTSATAANPVPEFSYEVNEWRGQDWFPPTVKGFSIEFKEGDAFMILAPRKCQSGSTVMILPPRAWTQLISHSVFIDDMTNTEYRQHIQERLRNKYSDGDMSPIGDDINDGPSNVLGQFGVRIQK